MQVPKKRRKGGKMKRTNRSYLNNPYLKKPSEKGRRERAKAKQTKSKTRFEKWLDAVKKFMDSAKIFFENMLKSMYKP